MPSFHYEFPNGFNGDYASERLRIAESLFDPAIAKSSAQEDPSATGDPKTLQPANTPQSGLNTPANISKPGAAATHQQPPVGVPQLILNAINRCDIDIRQSLFNAVIVTGGNTLLQGFTERLQSEVASRAPANMKQKLYAATGSTERRFGAWVGGSILASLGNFQQMWISRQDFDESGKAVVEKKCP